MDTYFGRSRFLIYALPLLLITIMITTAGAQGFSPFALPGGLFGQGARGQYPSNFGCAGDPGGGLSVLVGYASNAGINKFRFDSPILGPGGIFWRQYDYDTTSALYLGAELPIELGSMGKALLSGSLTIPATMGLRLDNWDAAAPIGNFGNRWDANTIWGTLQGLYAYPAFGCSALAGFRWDHWQTSLKNRTDITPRFAVAQQSDTGAFTLNGYIPLVGVASCGRGFTFGVVGFPWVPGDFEFAECRNLGGLRNDTGSGKFKRAWFVEVFTDYRLAIPRLISLPASADANLWLFGKFNYMEAKTNFTFTRSTAPGVIITAVDTDFSFYRAMFVVGAKATLGFNMPNVRGWF